MTTTPPRAHDESRAAPGVRRRVPLSPRRLELTPVTQDLHWGKSEKKEASVRQRLEKRERYAEGREHLGSSQQTKRLVKHGVVGPWQVRKNQVRRR